MRNFMLLVERFHIPCVIADFEPFDILSAVYMLTRQADRGQALVKNCYGRVVSRKNLTFKLIYT